MTSQPAEGSAAEPKKKPGKGVDKTPRQKAPLEPVPSQPAFTDEDAKTVAHIINLQIAGWTLDEIASATSMERDDVEALLLRRQRRFVRTQKELVGHMRGLAGDRLDRLLKSVWADATDDDSPKQFPAQDRALRIIEQQRKLWGLDAPVQMEISHRPSDEAVADLVEKVSAAIHGVPIEDDDVLELDPEDYREVDDEGDGDDDSTGAADDDRAQVPDRDDATGVRDADQGDAPAAFEIEAALDTVAAARAARAGLDAVPDDEEVGAEADPEEG